MVSLKAGTTALLTLIVIVAIFLMFRSPPMAEMGGELIIAQSLEPDTLYIAIIPGTRPEATSVASLIYDTLITFDWNMSHRPLLARSWEIDPGEPGIIFHLRRDVRFHCGHPFTAHAVKFNLEMRKDLPHEDPELDMITDATVLNDYAIKVHLKKEDRFVLDWFARAHSGMICPKCIEEYTSLRLEYGANYACGTGPFKLKEWVRGSKIVLERNENYGWGPEIYQNQGPAHLDNITFIIIPDDSVREAEFEAGRVNLLLDMPRRPELMREWGEDKNIEVIVKPKPSLIYVGFNCSTPGLQLPVTAENSPVNDVRVRRAIEHTVYRRKIIEDVYENMASPAHGPLATSIWGYLPEIENMYPYDLERARSLLSQAGYANGVRLEVLAIPPDSGLAKALREQLSTVGIDLSVKVVYVEELEHLVREGRYDMFIRGYAWHDASMIHFLFHTSRLPPGRNRFWWGSAYSDAVIDNTFSLDDGIALRAIQEAQRLVMEDAVLIPLVEHVHIMAHRAEVKGFRMHPLGGLCWKHLDTYVE